ncbi:MAG: hypothetical protein LBH13_10445 [Cellulomonadaceae bacterium]|jgi:hypothetical protein|nr:hypothetical protein [Cellulomonadaceae bacterium]
MSAEDVEALVGREADADIIDDLGLGEMQKLTWKDGSTAALTVGFDDDKAVFMNLTNGVYDTVLGSETVARLRQGMALDAVRQVMGGTEPSQELWALSDDGDVVNQLVFRQLPHLGNGRVTVTYTDGSATIITPEGL